MSDNQLDPEAGCGAPAAAPAGAAEPGPGADAPAEDVAPKDRRNAAREAERIRSLHRLSILDTAEDPTFDRIAELAHRILGGMGSAVSFVDVERQWFKASCGLNICESPRSAAFCHYTVQGEDLFVVENALEDERFRDNPFVTGPANLRAYAGAPVKAPDRRNVGSLCVLDDKPRIFTSFQKIVLRLLADLAEDAIRLHVARLNTIKVLEDQGRQMELLKLKNRQLAQAEAIAEIGVFSVDAKTETACFSDIVHRLLDKRPDEPFTFAEFLSRFPPEDAEAVRAALMGRGPRGIDFERPVTGADGTVRWLRLSAEVLGTPSGHYRIVGTLQNVTDQRRHLDEIAFLRRHDPLTGLLNRSGFDQAMAEALPERAAGDKVALFLIDIDDFLLVNDRFGRDWGDEILKRVAGRLSETVRRGDAVARLGSDEFAVLLTGVRSRRDMARVRRRILNALDFRADIAGERVRVSASVGLGVAPDDVSEGHDLYQAAEAAMQEAKRQGNGRFQRFEPSLKENRDRYRLFVEEVRRGLKDCQFRTFLQPKVRLSDGTLVGFEALLRWAHPERGVLGPHFFIEALEDEEIGGDLSDVTFAGAFEIAGSFRRRAIRLEHFSINLNSMQLERPHLVKEAEALSRIHDVPPSMILFEVVENVLIRDRAEVQNNLRRLSEAGFGVSLDDFGTGYASLTNIREPFIREVKIDRSFVIRCTSSEHDRQIVGAIVNMGRNMGLEVVAEGVETEGHVEVLQSIGCEVGQGYLFAAPMTVTEAIRFALRKQRIDRLLPRPEAD